MNVLDAQIIKADRYGDADWQLRAPQLAFLAGARVVVFGLGCVGAPSALEFARAGVGGLHLVDDDVVDAATTVRWPFGLASAGLPKAQVLPEFINRNYPRTLASFDRRRVGAVRVSAGTESEGVWLDRILRGASLVYDATAEPGIQDYLSDVAYRRRIPYVTVTGTRGGWGGEVTRIVPGRTGCWRCVRKMYKDNSIPVPSEDATAVEQPAGCGDPTFKAAGFDMLQVAVMGVRMAVSTLANGREGAYPSMKWDGVVMSMRDGDDGSLILPKYEGYNVPVHERCVRCNRAQA